jgi:hypothetical protein
MRRQEAVGRVGHEQTGPCWKNQNDYFAGGLAQTMSYFWLKVTNIRQGNLDLQVDQCMVLLGMTAAKAKGERWHMTNGLAWGNLELWKPWM